MIELAHGFGPAAPVIDLWRLARVGASELEQCQSADRILRKLHTPKEYACSGPARSVLDHERGAMDSGVRHSLRQQKRSAADQCRGQATN